MRHKNGMMILSALLVSTVFGLFSWAGLQLTFGKVSEPSLGSQQLATKQKAEPQINPSLESKVSGKGSEKVSEKEGITKVNSVLNKDKAKAPAEQRQSQEALSIGGNEQSEAEHGAEQTQELYWRHRARLTVYPVDPTSKPSTGIMPETKETEASGALRLKLSFSLSKPLYQ